MAKRRYLIHAMDIFISKGDVIMTVLRQLNVRLCVQVIDKVEVQPTDAHHTQSESHLNVVEVHIMSMTNNDEVLDDRCKHPYDLHHKHYRHLAEELVLFVDGV